MLGLAATAQVKITQSSDRISIGIDGQPFTDFFIGADTNKPYLHPLRTASGKMVTRQYPMAAVEGESRDHQHHRGLWFTYGDVNGVDFWANESSYPNRSKLGKIRVRKIVDLKNGKKSGVVHVLFDWDDPAGKTILTEDRTMTFYSDPGLRTIDFDVRLTAANGQVVFGDTKEGAFAIRLADPLTQKHTGKLVNAEGASGMDQVWGKRSDWNDYSGTLDGEAVGILILDHPSNPRHPPFWHSRDYGLFAVNPFGERDFTGQPPRLGSFSLEPGQSARFRWRVIIHPGDAQAVKAAEAYRKYASIK